MCDQARKGGVRLPGRAFPVAGKKTVGVSHDLRGLVRLNDRIRIGRRLCRINPTAPNAVDKKSIHLRFCWLGESIGPGTGEPGDGLCLYRMPPQARCGLAWTAFGRATYENQMVQGVIRQYRGYHAGVGRYQLAASRQLRHWLPKLATKMEAWSKEHAELQNRVKWWTWEWQLFVEAAEGKKRKSVAQSA